MYQSSRSQPKSVHLSVLEAHLGTERPALPSPPPQTGTKGYGQQLPAEAELLLMIKGPLVTQVEKSPSDPRFVPTAMSGTMPSIAHRGDPLETEWRRWNLFCYISFKVFLKYQDFILSIIFIY